MFNNVYIFNDASSRGRSVEFESGENKSFCYILDLSKREEGLAFIASCFQEDSGAPFSIGVKKLGLAPASHLNDVAMLVAHPLYSRIEETVEVCLLEEGNSEDGVGRLLTFLHGQGYEKIRINRICNSDLSADFVAIHLAGSEERVFIREDDFKDYYYQYLSSSYNYEDRFFIQLKRSLTDKEKVEWVCKVERDFFSVNPYIAALLQENYRSKRKCNTLEQIAQSRINELQTISKLFAISSEANEVDQILQFYHKEYESLPLWYKRVGHIIKIITGKRDWRSVLDGKRK